MSLETNTIYNGDWKDKSSYLNTLEQNLLNNQKISPLCFLTLHFEDKVLSV